MKKLPSASSSSSFSSSSSSASVTPSSPSSSTSSSSAFHVLPSALIASIFSYSSVIDHAAFTNCSRSMNDITRHPTWAAIASPASLTLTSSILFWDRTSSSSGSSGSGSNGRGGGRGGRGGSKAAAEAKKKKKQLAKRPQLPQQQKPPPLELPPSLLRLRPKVVNARAFMKRHNAPQQLHLIGSLLSVIGSSVRSLIASPTHSRGGSGNGSDCWSPLLCSLPALTHLDVGGGSSGSGVMPSLPAAVLAELCPLIRSLICGNLAFEEEEDEEEDDEKKQNKKKEKEKKAVMWPHLTALRCQPKTYATLAAITREFSSSLTDLRFTGNLVMGPREHGERVLRFWPRAPTNRPATATSSFDGGVHVMGVLSRVTSLHVDRCGFYQPDLFLMCNALGPVLPRLERINLFNNMHLSFPGPLGDAFGSSLTCLDLVGNSHSNGQGYFNLGKPLPACPILRALRMPLGSEAAISELPGFYPVLRELQLPPCHAHILDDQMNSLLQLKHLQWLGLRLVQGLTMSHVSQHCNAKHPGLRVLQIGRPGYCGSGRGPLIDFDVAHLQRCTAKSNNETGAAIDATGTAVSDAIFEQLFCGDEEIFAENPELDQQQEQWTVPRPYPPTSTPFVSCFTRSPSPLD